MAQEVRLQGRTYSDVPSILLPDSNNVFHPFTDVSDTTATASDVATGKYFYLADGTKTQGTGTGGGGRGAVTQDQDGYLVLSDQGGGGSDAWSWMGKNPTLVKDYAVIKEYLEDTPYATWTPTTSSTTLINPFAYSIEAVTGLDFSRHDYVITHRWHTHFEYDNSATGTGQASDFYFASFSDAFGFANDLTNMTDGTVNTCTALVGGSRYGLFYKNGSGADAYSRSTYGVYVSSMQSPSASFSGSITPTFPYVYARCSDTYFSVRNAAAVKQDESYFEYKVQVWAVDFGTSNDGVSSNAIRDMWLNGF